MGEKITFCRGGGCTAKLGAGILSRVLERLPKGPEDPNLLIGYDSKDDAAVYKVSDDIAIVQTLDFFPPMVEDPYTFGKIAATNALSDIYAMGGEVKTALNIVCFPEQMAFESVPPSAFHKTFLCLLCPIGCYFLPKQLLPDTAECLSDCRFACRNPAVHAAAAQPLIQKQPKPIPCRFPCQVRFGKNNRIAVFILPARSGKQEGSEFLHHISPQS